MPKPTSARAALTYLILSICLLSTASAHYLWVTLDPKTGEQGTANIYFEGGPSAGDGQYLDPFFQRGTTWIRTVDAIEPARLKVTEVKKKDKRWMSAALSAAAPRSIDSYGMWGVYRYGKTDVLLHYYARHLDVSDHEALHDLARAKQMALDIVPHETDGGMELTVLWNGTPAADRTVYMRGPKSFKQNLKTDKKGKVQFKAEAEGRYLLRTSVEEKKSGTQDGKAYLSPELPYMESTSLSGLARALVDHRSEYETKD